MSAEAVIDAIKYMFKKSVQVEGGELVRDIERGDFVPKKYLEATLTSHEDEQDDNRPILLPKRIIDIPIDNQTCRYVRRFSRSLRRSSASQRLVSHRARHTARRRLRERRACGSRRQSGDAGESSLRRDRV